MSTAPAYILAGGRSSRFGSDKARALIAGQPMILHVASSIAPFAQSITVVADAPDKYGDLGLRTIADESPHLGPLGGLAAALQDCSPGATALVTSCDLIFLDGGRALGLLLGEARADDLALVHFDERWRPFPGLYSRLLLPAIGARLCSDDRSIRTLLAERARPIAGGQFSSWAADANTPEAMVRASDMLSS